nr:hypothetical protein [Candidatus Sigynarchaeum springense]
MVDLALHQGQSICFSCFTTCMLVLYPHPCGARRERLGMSMTLFNFIDNHVSKGTPFLILPNS